MFLPLEGLYAEVMRNAEVVETLSGSSAFW